jgi:hypothetical protein
VSIGSSWPSLHGRIAIVGDSEFVNDRTILRISLVKLFQTSTLLIYKTR